LALKQGRPFCQYFVVYRIVETFTSGVPTAILSVTWPLYTYNTDDTVCHHLKVATKSLLSYAYLIRRRPADERSHL